MEKGNHLITGATFLAAAAVVAYTQTPEQVNAYLPTVQDKVIFCASYLLSTSLPDIDQKTRLVRHRTFTHSFLFLAILFLPGLVYPALLGPFFASAHHILMDMFSAQGVALLWPFQGYIRYDSGRSVKKGYHITLYRAKSTAESVVAMLICLFNFAIAGVFLLRYFRIL